MYLTHIMTKNFTKSQLKEKKEFFNKNGFVVFENVLSKNDLNKVRKKYKKIFKGQYETGVVPDKIKWVYGRDKNNIPRSVCNCLLYTSPSPRDRQKSRMPSSA